MPPLGQDFIDHVSRLIAAQRPDLAPVDGAVLLPAHRELWPLVAKERQRADEAQIEPGYWALRPLAQAVPWRLLEQGPRALPCDGGALRIHPSWVGDQAREPADGATRLGIAARMPSGPGVAIRAGRVRGRWRGHAPLVRATDEREALTARFADLKQGDAEEQG